MANEIILPKPEIRKVSIIDQLKKLDDERAKLVDGAKAEALKAIDKAITDLKGLGFAYSLVGAEAVPKKKGGAGKPRTKKDCTICKFGTDPHHDGRHPAHRDQGENKKAFSEKQLADLSLKKKA